MGKQSVGMMYPVWAPFESHTAGSMPTYGTGRVIMEARTADVNITRADNPDYGDDREIDRDDSITALSISFEPSGISNEDRQEMLGEEEASDSSLGGQWISDTSSPYGGFAYIEKMRENGEYSYEVWLTLKIQFHEDSRSTKTREGQITWGHPKFTGNAAGIDIDGSDVLRYQWHDNFETLSEAKAKIDALLNVSSGTTTNTTPAAETTP